MYGYIITTNLLSQNAFPDVPAKKGILTSLENSHQVLLLNDRAQEPLLRREQRCPLYLLGCIIICANGRSHCKYNGTEPITEHQPNTYIQESCAGEPPKDPTIEE